VTKVVKEGDALGDGVEMARDLVEGSNHSFGWSKQRLTVSFHTVFEAQLERERAGLESCTAHPDGKEGLLAFAETRSPRF